MKTTLEIDEKLVEEAMKASGTKTMKAAIELGLKELISARRRKALALMIGNTDFDLTHEDLDSIRKSRVTDVPD